MKFGSVCSGIEAASVAFEPLGWKAAWFSEIEPFPCAVLKHHYPDTPNHGDMTTLPKRIKSGEVEAPDLFCGGTPCQAFSVAGLRQSLSDDRGNLSLTFCEIANAIDDVRLARGEPPAIIFWENVPGVLSTTDNAFGCFLGALSGCDTPILPGRLGWTDAGVVAGPQRTVAWRVLDAQYFGLAQRRRRVFVVASARDGFNPAEVLLEFQGLRRDFAPSREAGQRPPGCAPQGLGVGGELARALTAAHTATGRLDPNEATFVTHSLRGEGFDASKDGTGRGTPLVPVSIEIGPSGAREVDVNPTLDTRAKDGPIRNQLAGAVLQPVTYADVAPTLTSNGDAHTGYRDEHGLVPVAFHPTQDPISSQDVCHAIGTGNRQGCATAAVAFGFDGDVMKDGLMETMTTREGAISDTAHAVMQPVSIQGNLIGRNVGGPQGVGASQNGVMYTLTKMDVHGAAQPIVLMDQGGSVMNVMTDGTMGTLRRETHGHEPTIVTSGTIPMATRPVNQKVPMINMQGSKGSAVSQEDGPSFTLNAMHGHDVHAILQPIPLDLRNAGRDAEKHDEMNRQGVGVGEPGDPSHTVTSACVHGVAHPIAWDEELNASVDQAGTLLRGGQGGRHDGVLAPTLTASNDPSRSPQSSEITAQVAAVFEATAAVTMRESGQGYWMQDEIAGTIDANMDMSGHANRPAVIKQMAMQVRRLTPVECERLQGFPDGYTAIPWRGKPTEECPDGPRYKALGNSWAVPCVQWIGRRIQQGVQGKVPS